MEDHKDKDKIHDPDKPDNPEHNKRHEGGPATTESETDPGTGITVGGPPAPQPEPGQGG